MIIGLDVNYVLEDILDEKGANAISNIKIENILDYVKGSFDEKVHELYTRYGNYFLAYKGLDKKMFESWQRFNNSQ